MFTITTESKTSAELQSDGEVSKLVSQVNYCTDKKRRCRIICTFVEIIASAVGYLQPSCLLQLEQHRRMGSMVSQDSQDCTKLCKRKSNGEYLQKMTNLSCCKNSVSPGRNSPQPLISNVDTRKAKTKNSGMEDRKAFQDIPEKKVKLSRFAVKTKQRLGGPQEGGFLFTYLRLFDDEIIQDFMWTDCCAVLVDKYLIAMVYTYFRRAGLSKKEYTRLNFFLALHLAHDVEEDNEDIKQEIYPWALGKKWESKYVRFLLARDLLWKKMGYRAFVSRLTCEEIFDLCPDHPIWKRQRKGHHGGATRIYPQDEEEPVKPRGPDKTPIFCDLCFFSGSPDSPSINTSGYLSYNTEDSLSD